MQRPNAVRPLRVVIVILGFAFGAYFAYTSPFRGAPLWPAWAPLVIGSTGAAGLVFNYGLNRWAELTRYRGLRVRISDVAPRIAIIWGAVTIGVVVLVILPIPVRVTWRHVALISVLLLGSLPAAGVMGAIHYVADRQCRPGTRGEQTAQLIRLRGLLQRLLAAVGSLVALSTLALGASIRLEQGLRAGTGHAIGHNLQPQFVLVFGGIGSVLVALFYVPAGAALQRRGQCLADELFPLSRANEAGAILSAADDRHKLELLLGVDRGIFTDLQSGLAILGPLLASAVAAFLSP